jgi:hypothetical protein
MTEGITRTAYRFLGRVKRWSQMLGITSELPVVLPQWATANRQRQGALTESRTTIAGDPFYREWLCDAGQG